MKKLLPTLLPLLSTIVVALVPDAQHFIATFVTTHPAWSSLITAAGLIFNHWIPSPGTTPSDSAVAKIGTTSLLCFCLVAMLTISSGCRHNVNTSNPKVVAVSVLLDAATTVDTVATSLSAANDVVEKLETTEPAYYAKVKPWLQKIAKANTTASHTVRAAQTGDTAADWRGALVAITAAAGSEDPAVFGFKNPESQQAVRIGFAALIAALQSIPQKFSTPGGN